MKIRVLVFFVCSVCLGVAMANVSAQSGNSKLRIISDVQDGKSGFVYLDGKLVTRMRPGKRWEIDFPNRLLDPIVPKNMEITMCNTFVVPFASLPPWAMSTDTAGVDAITPQFLESAPVSFEVGQRFIGILTFLESQRHPDLANMRIRIVEWIKQTNEIGVECDSPITLKSFLPSGDPSFLSLTRKNPLLQNNWTQNFFIRGSRFGGYRLDK